VISFALPANRLARVLCHDYVSLDAPKKVASAL